MIAYPWIEKRLTGDDAHHNLLQRPRDVPVRTAIGAMSIAFYVVLTISCINDIIAYKFAHLAERDDVDRPYRHGHPAADRVLRDVPVLHRPAAQ